MHFYDVTHDTFRISKSNHYVESLCKSNMICVCLSVCTEGFGSPLNIDKLFRKLCILEISQGVFDSINLNKDAKIHGSEVYSRSNTNFYFESGRILSIIFN